MLHLYRQTPRNKCDRFLRTPQVIAGRGLRITLSGGYMPIIERRLSVPEVILIAGTRVALGIGIGLLLSDRFNRDQRRAAGLALVAVGAATTIPLAISVIGKKADATSIDLKRAA